MANLEIALKISVEAHRGQKHKYGAPYILHPLRVMARVNSAPEKIVAILHDVVEDTEWTLEQLRKEGFSEEIVEAIDCLTKREGEADEEFVKRSASNPLARRVKLAGLEDNVDLRRMETVTTKDMDQLNKYLRAWRYLASLATA